MALAREGESNGDQFALNSWVLAMYPNTTSFYKALIVGPPQRKMTASGAVQDLCIVQFEDDEDEITRLPRRHLVPVRFVCFRPEIVLG